MSDEFDPSWGEQPAPRKEAEPLKKARSGWLNIYSNHETYLHDTREDADICGMPNRIACIRIQFEEGEGL